VDVYIHVYLTSALVGSEWSASCPGRFTPRGKSPRYPLGRRLYGPQPVWTTWRRPRTPTAWSSSPEPVAVAIPVRYYIYIYTTVVSDERH
jgi:hypothetical protein